MFTIVLRPLVWLTASLTLLTTVLSLGSSRQSAAAEAPLPVAPSLHVVGASGQVKWHKSFEDAKAASLRSGKPVLLFNTGQTILHACGASSVGVMLFSSLEVAGYINANYEPIWESGPLKSLILVDFGTASWADRRSAATYVCGSDGVVYDVLVGTYPPDVYRKQLEAMKRFADSLRPFTMTRDTPTEIERQRSALSRDARLREHNQQRQAELFGPLTGRGPAQQSLVFGGANGFGCNFCGFNCCGGVQHCYGVVGYPPHSNYYGFGSFSAYTPPLSNYYGFGSHFCGFGSSNFSGVPYTPFREFGSAPLK